jgi:acetolactate synthase I/II/III large subunit
MKDLVSHQLVRYLEDRGVEHLFGLCGHSNIALLAAMANSSIRFVNTRHEQIAAHIADGYARARGAKTSVMLSHCGPGLTNAATGVATAQSDSIPMVVIAGDIPSHMYGRHPHQEINLHADAQQYEIYRPFVKRAWRIDRADKLPEIMEKAFQLAESGRPGPVLVSVPMDMFSAEIDVALWDRAKKHTRHLQKPSIDDVTAERIVMTLADAKNPVLYVGGGVMLSQAYKELAEFADHMSFPVAHSLMGKGVVPDDHPMVIGMTGFWGTEYINKSTRTADWIMALGTRFCEADSSSFEDEYTFDIPNHTKLIHIDIDDNEIGRNYPVQIGAVADLKQALTVLLRVARKLFPAGRANDALRAEIAQYHAEFKASRAAHEASTQYPMRPERILSDLRAVMPRDFIMTTDVGWNKNGVGQQFDILTPGSILTPGGFATMGFGSPAAIGAKIACPDRVVVSLVGDGGFGQNPAALATAVEENVPVIWVIMNNGAYGTIAGLQKAHYGTTVGTIFHKPDGEPYSPDYAALARAYGVEGVRINSADEFKPALEKAVASGRPYVLDVIMENAPVPTAGHWNIMDIYSPGKKVHHVAT